MISPTGWKIAALEERRAERRWPTRIGWSERRNRGGNCENGWGGWTRTTTVLINSEVPYRLDHAPAGHGILSKISWIAPQFFGCPR